MKFQQYARVSILWGFFAIKPKDIHCQKKRKKVYKGNVLVYCCF